MTPIRSTKMIANTALSVAFFALFTLLTSISGADSASDSVRAGAGVQPTKAEVLTRLRQLQARQVQEIGTLEDSVKKALKDSTSLSLREDLNVAGKKISRLGDALNETDKRRTELLARREFVDQLILLIDSKWDGKMLATFLEHSLLDIANGDLTNTQHSGENWRFMTYLSIVVREVPEQREDVLGVVESYMNYANVLNPRSPAEFMANRNYTNGSEAVAAHAVSRDSVGDYVERRTRELSKLRAHSNQRASAPMTALRGANNSAQRDERGTESGTTSAPAADSPAVPAKRLDLELRARKPSVPTAPNPEINNADPRDSGTMRLETPSEDEKPEQVYVSPRLKALNSY